jgi:hypothetical protein
MSNNPTPPQSEREELVSKLVLWFDEQAHMQLEAPTADLDWRRSAEELADFILEREAEAETLEVVDELKQIYAIAHSGLDDTTEIRTIRKYIDYRLVALTPKTTKEDA